MKKLITALSLTALLAGAAPALAQSTIKAHDGVITTTQVQKKGKQIEKVTCREFLALQDRFRPEAVSYAIGYDKAHKPDDAVLDIMGIARLTPVIEKKCQTRPQESLMQRIRAELRRL